VEEEDTRDITMKRSKIGKNRLIPWIRSPRKKDKHAQSPDKIDKGIFMADAVANFKLKTVKTLGSTRLPTVLVKTLELKN
jgi:hypothetical protein